MKHIRHSSRANQGTLMGQELYRTEDKFGTILVTQRENKRILSFDSKLEQSCVLINKPYYLMHEYTQAMLLGLLFTNAQTMTCLGLGGGGLVHCLTHYFPQASISVIEIRKAVIDIAYQWFHVPKSESLTIINADAFAYMLELPACSSDIIFSDLYEAEGMSACQAQDSFVSSCYQSLSKSGCLVLNFHQLPHRDSTLVKTLKRLFCALIVFDTGDKDDKNSILFCCKSAPDLHHPLLNEKAERLSQQVKMPLLYYYQKLESY
ncbi:MAG: hypothetical protein V3V19_09430 [Cocleimonas sp.]